MLYVAYRSLCLLPKAFDYVTSTKYWIKYTLIRTCEKYFQTFDFYQYYSKRNKLCKIVYNNIIYEEIFWLWVPTRFILTSRGFILLYIVIHSILIIYQRQVQNTYLTRVTSRARTQNTIY